MSYSKVKLEEVPDGEKAIKVRARAKKDNKVEDLFCDGRIDNSDAIRKCVAIAQFGNKKTVAFWTLAEDHYEILSG